jgi:hypothetical protein
MPPKKVVEAAEANEDLYTLVKNMSVQITNINAKMSKVDSIDAEVKTLESVARGREVGERPAESGLEGKGEDAFGHA